MEKPPDQSLSSLRVDLWLDVACLFKTRTEAQHACKGGKVDVNGQAAKPHREVKPGDVIEGKGWKVTVGRATHVQPYLECLAYRLDAPDGSVCYTGDSGASDEIVALAKGCDVLIHMNHYFSGTAPSPAYRAACGNHRDNAVTAKKAGVKTLVLTHLLAQIDQPRVREQIVQEIRQEFDGRVVWGEDLMELGFTLPQVAKIEGY